MAISTKFRLHANAKDSYLQLVLSFPLASIRSNEHLKAAQIVIDRLLIKGRLNAGESLYLDALSDLVATHEDEHHAIEPASDAEMLRHLLDAKGASQADLHRSTTIPKSTISEVLSGKRPFSRQMIRRLATYFQIDIGILSANL